MILVIGELGTIHKCLVRELEELEIGGRVETIQSIVKIGQNTEKSPGNMKRLANPVVKNSQGIMIIIIIKIDGVHGLTPERWHRLCVSCKEWIRGLANIEDYLDATIWRILKEEQGKTKYSS